MSYPCDKAVSGKFAVKVINHYGDEVLKVFGVYAPLFVAQGRIEIYNPHMPTF